MNEKNKLKSSFSSSHHSKLCEKCTHIFLDPQARLNQISQLYHIERQLKPKSNNNNDNIDIKPNDIIYDIEEEKEEEEKDEIKCNKIHYGRISSTQYIIHQ